MVLITVCSFIWWVKAAVWPSQKRVLPHKTRTDLLPQFQWRFSWKYMPFNKYSPSYSREIRRNRKERRRLSDPHATETWPKKLSTRCTVRIHISSVCLKRTSYWFNCLPFLTEDFKVFFCTPHEQIFLHVRLPFPAVVVDEYDLTSQLKFWLSLRKDRRGWIQQMK